MAIGRAVVYCDRAALIFSARITVCTVGCDVFFVTLHVVPLQAPSRPSGKGDQDGRIS